MSERLVDEVFDNQGYQAVDPNILGVPGSQGFDNVLIKRDASGTIEDVIINESKQLNSSSAGFQMGSAQGNGISNCNNCVQMSDDWINDVLSRMENSGQANKVSLAQELQAFGEQNFSLTVSGVDRLTGELNIISINNF